MKRLHIHVGVENIEQAIPFYSALFGAQPVKTKADYAKWLLDDPRVNFAISQRGRQPGVNHLGFQVEDDAELKAMRGQLEAADAGLLEQTNAACCYAVSDKYWVTDPQGVAWETFHTLDSVPVYGEDTRSAAMQSACCIPLAPSESGEKVGACCTPLPQATASTSDKACCP